MNKILFLSLIITALATCKKQTINPIKKKPILVEKDTFLINSFIWTTEFHHTNFQHPFLSKGNFIFFTPSTGRFHGFDMKTGEENWQTEILSLNRLLDRNMILREGDINFILFSKLNQINSQNGTMETISISNDSIKGISPNFNFIDNNIYGPSSVRISENAYNSNMLGCPIENIESGEFRLYAPSLCQGDTARPYGIPILYNNTKGERILVYQVYERYDKDNFFVNYSSLEGFNMDQDSVEWLNYRISERSFNNYMPPLIDENRGYFNWLYSMNCVDLNTGKVLWEFGKDQGFNDRFDFHGGGIYKYEDKIIVVGRDEQVCALDKVTGKKLWEVSFKVGSDEWFR